MPSEFRPLNESDLWCSTTEEMLASEKFVQFLRIYNRETAGTRIAVKEATIEDVKNDRDLRMRMRSYFRNQLHMKITGTDHAKLVVRLSELVDAANDVLDERNKKIRLKEIEEDSDEGAKMMKMPIRSKF